MSRVYQEIKRCRWCEHRYLVRVFSLGMQHMTGFPMYGQPNPPKAPLEVVVCEKCGLPQLRHTVVPSVIYGDYFYRSGISNTMRAALRNVVEKAMAVVPLRAGDAVVDIGSNDGTLLACYPDWVRRTGFEPSNIAQHTPQGIEVIGDYFSRSLYEGKAKIVTSCAVFYDVGDPRRFIGDVVFLLDQDGVWVNQMNYLPLILKNTAYDFLSHEHVAFWDLTRFVRACQLYGLEPFDVEISALNGGTFRVYVQHKGGPHAYSDRLPVLMHEEEKAWQPSTTMWTAFDRRVERVTQALQEVVSQATRDGKKVFIRGASTRGYVILQHAKLDHWISVAVDRDPRKRSRRYGASKIKIISEEEARDMRPDYYLPFIYSYLPELLSREAGFLQRGGKFIVPLPEVRTVP